MFGGIDLDLLTQDHKERILVDAEAEIARLRDVQLDVLEDLDRCQVATADGCRSLSEWATARLDVHPETAKTLVRTMRRTVERPDLRDALASGEISTDPENLITLCWFHHQIIVHQQGFQPYHHPEHGRIRLRTPALRGPPG